MHFKLDFFKKKKADLFNSIWFSHMNQNICFCPAYVSDTVLLSISWKLCSKYIWVCLLIRIDVTFYLSNETVAQMFRRAPVYWPRSEHLELFHLPTSIHMLMFISETVISLARIAVSTPFLFGICFWEPLQYSLSNHEESYPSYIMLCLNSQFSIRIMHTPSPCPLTTHKG